MALFRIERVSAILSATVFAVLFFTKVAAHHSFDMFDKGEERWLDGTITAFQWTNPHAFIQLSVVENGKQTEWSLEGGSPNILGRNGWKRTSIKAGEKVRVLIYPLKNGEPGGSFLEVHKADGTVLYYHG